MANPVDNLSYTLISMIRESIPEMLNNKGSVGDAQILSDVLIGDLPPGTLLDIGCGDGPVAINTARRRTDINVLGIDIDSVACARVRDKIESEEITDRIKIICADVFTVKLPPSDAVCCNPPLLPDEQCFFVGSTTRNLFSQALVEKMDREQTSQLIYLHQFDFHGISERTGKLPCLAELANALGFSVTSLYKGIRQIGKNSRIRYNLPQLVKFFPEGTVLVDDLEIPMYKLSNVYTSTTDNLSIYQSVVRLSRQC